MHAVSVETLLTGKLGKSIGDQWDIRPGCVKRSVV